MRTRARSNPFFDTRSVLLFAAIAAGGVLASQARAADNTAPRSATAVIAQSAPANAAKPTPPAASNPANRPPAMAQQNDVPPMTTSPAFEPRTKADQGTGSADNPDKRPEITATEPTALSPKKGAASKPARSQTIPATRPTSGPAATEPTAAK